MYKSGTHEKRVWIASFNKVTDILWTKYQMSSHRFRVLDTDKLDYVFSRLCREEVDATQILNDAMKS